jgi:nucleoside-triphosphatase THEP1
VTPAVTIVTGAVNAGKTARMRELFRQAAKADGILSEKIFDKGGFCGYRLVHLRSGETKELALLETEYHGQFTEAWRLGSFVFSAEAFRFGCELLERLCANPGAGSIFLDEAGPLELEGQGFAGVLPSLLRSGKELYITVRGGCLQAFIRAYGIADYLLIPVQHWKSEG